MRSAHDPDRDIVGRADHESRFGLRQDFQCLFVGVLHGKARFDEGIVDIMAFESLLDAVASGHPDRRIGFVDPEDKNVPVSVRNRVRSDRTARLLVIVDDAVEIGMRLPDDDDGNISLFERLDMSRCDGSGEEDDAVDALLRQGGDGFDFALAALIRIRDQQLVFGKAQTVLQAPQRFIRRKGIQTRNDRPDHMRALRFQALGKFIRFIIMFGDDCIQLRLRFSADRPAVQIAGNRALRHAGHFSDVIDCDHG